MSSGKLNKSVSLKTSIVTYYIDESIYALLDSLIASALNIPQLSYKVVIVENGFKEKNEIHLNIEKQYPFCQVIIPGENLGYGRAHNLTIDSEHDYHLVLNPDIEFSADAFLKAFEFLQEHPECGLLAPQCFWMNGDRQYLCKRYPSVFVLFIRAFAPKFFQNLFRRKLEYYCMKEETQREQVLWNPLIVSGCFMLFRRDVLEKLKGFDPDFFLYFEDTDLSLRANKLTSIAYVPDVKIVHHGGNVSKKGVKHILLFTMSMIKFFNKHGWKCA
jgi:hypothetical protein